MILTFFRTIRWINLLIIAATMLAVRYLLIEPLLSYHDIPLQLEFHVFIIALASTLLISAAGYVINDYFDIEIDKINKPHRKHLPERVLYTLYWILNIMGLLGAGWLYYYFRNQNVFIFFLFVSGTLWFYSSQYKHQLIIGNVIVSVLTALIPILVLWLEMLQIQENIGIQLHYQKISLGYIVWWVVGFSYFAFLLTLIREIVKDIQDFEGDCSYGRNTMPIVFGINTTLVIVSLLVLQTIASLLYIYFNYLREAVTLTYISLFLILPLVYVIARFYIKRKTSIFKQLNMLLKIIMILGISYAWVAKLLIEAK